MNTTRGRRWEDPDKEWEADAYTAKGWASGVAWIVYGWELEADEDTEWSGCYNRTGRILARMVGDDQIFTFEPDEVTAITEEDFCLECGQIGCHGARISG